MVTQNSINTGKPIEVAKGGTGVATTTAYAVLCGGTTATNPLQPIASVGTADQVLTSNGAALPTFQDVPNPGFSLISSQTASGTADIEFLSLVTSTTTGQYFIVGNLLRPTTAGDDFFMEISDDNGSTWESTNYLAGINYNLHTVNTLTNSNSTAYLPIGISVQGGSSVLDFTMHLQTTTSAHAYGRGQSVWSDNASSNTNLGTFGGRLSAVTGVDAVRFKFSTDTIAYGRISLYLMNRA